MKLIQCTCICSPCLSDGKYEIMYNGDDTGFCLQGVTRGTVHESKAWSGKESEKEADIEKMTTTLENSGPKMKILKEDQQME